MRCVQYSVGLFQFGCKGHCGDLIMFIASACSKLQQCLVGNSWNEFMN